jgi:hypothetical protein
MKNNCYEDKTANNNCKKHNFTLVEGFRDFGNCQCPLGHTFRSVGKHKQTLNDTFRTFGQVFLS